MSVRKALIVSIACGAAAMILSAIFIHLKEIEVAGGGVLQEVLVAAADIGQQTLMEPGLVEVRKIPRAFVQPGALKDRREILGRVNITRIKEGEQILGSKLISGGRESGLSFKLHDEKRAVSISFSDSDCAGGLIQPDDHVDIVVTFDYGSSDKSDKYTYALFQDVMVLAVDAKVHSVRNPEGVAVVERRSKELFDSLPQMSGGRSGERVLTLAMGYDDAQKLIFADKAGDISILLRSPLDDSVYDERQAVSIETLGGRSGLTQKGYREYRGK